MLRCAQHDSGPTLQSPCAGPGRAVRNRFSRLESVEHGKFQEIDVFLEFIRYLSKEDLEQEPIEQSEVKSRVLETLKAAGLFRNDP